MIGQCQHLIRLFDFQFDFSFDFLLDLLLGVPLP